MDRLSPEILLSIFKRLSSPEMVSVMRVCREWLEIIDEHRSLWRELILPDEDFREDDLEILELFDRKSGSTLTQVSMNIQAFREKAVKAAFIDILKKSKDTLQVLDSTGGWDERFQIRLADEVWAYPRLGFCRLDTVPSPPVQLILSGRGKELAAHDHQGSPLRVLWVLDSKGLFKSDLPLLSNLVSLSVCASHDSLRWRRVLEGPSQSLRALEDLQEHSISALEFPNIAVLDLDSLGSCNDFPNWLKCPSSATFIIRDAHLFTLLPPCSRLWIDHVKDVGKLQGRCPELLELRLRLETEYLNPVDCAELISMLRQRKSNVEAGMEVDGVKMIPLKTLVLPFRLAKEGNVPLLRELVEEVVDLDSVSRFIELEV